VSLYTTYAARFASFLDIQRGNNSEDRLRTKNYDSKDDFNFPILNMQRSDKKKCISHLYLYGDVLVINKVKKFKSDTS